MLHRLPIRLGIARRRRAADQWKVMAEVYHNGSYVYNMIRFLLFFHLLASCT